METDRDSYFERTVYSLKDQFVKYRVPYLTSLAAGLLAYMFAFTNKLVNLDEIMCLYTKGAGVSSGRWGLELIDFVFPNYSMPWLYGAVSLILLSAAICLMLDMLEIKNKVVQAVLAAVIITFPAQIDTFCYMFASSSYAVAVLMAVLSVWLFAWEKKYRWIVCPLLLACSMGIYQAYLGIASSLLVLLLIKRCIDGEDTREIFRSGMRFLLMLAASVGLYLLVMLASFMITGETLNGYAASGMENVGLLHRLINAYLIFPKLLFREYFGYITRGLSRVMNCVCVLLTAVELVVHFAAIKDGKRRGLLLLLIVLFPLSISYIYLISETVHTLVLYGFISVYLLFGVLADGRILHSRRVGKDILLTAMTLIAISNITFANSVYLKQYLQYENAVSFYTSVVTQMKMTEDYDPFCTVAVIGDADLTVSKTDNISGHYMAGVLPDLVNVYSRDALIRCYVGYDVKFATQEEIDAVTETEEYKNMPVYPYVGSIRRIDDFMVVKLS